MATVKITYINRDQRWGTLADLTDVIGGATNLEPDYYGFVCVEKDDDFYMWHASDVKKIEWVE